MPSKHELFWRNRSFAVVGRSDTTPFPELTYKALKAAPETTVFAIDPTCDTIDGDPAYDDLEGLPAPVDAIVLEVPKEETASWIKRAADAGIGKIWIHMGRETPEALALARENGIEVCTGTCAVQYLDPSFPHSIHKFFRTITGRW
jgi:predicted CoA-binding protein